MTGYVVLVTALAALTGATFSSTASAQCLQIDPGRTVQVGPHSVVLPGNVEADPMACVTAR